MPGIKQGFTKCSDDEKFGCCHQVTGEAQAGRAVSERINQFITTFIIFHLLHCRHLLGHRAGEECLLKLEFGHGSLTVAGKGFLQGGIKLVTRSPGVLVWDLVRSSSKQYLLYGH